MAAYLARRGHRVVLVERQSKLFSGSTWNLAREEFAALRCVSALKPEQWDACITGDFERGLFRLHDTESGGRERDFDFKDCLNLSLDEAAFYEALAPTPGLDVRLSTWAELDALTEDAAYVRCRPSAGGGSSPSFVIRARLLIDARGWRSPLALAVHPERRVESVYNMLGVVTRGPVGWAARPHADGDGNDLTDDAGNPLGIICATYQDAVRMDGVLAQAILERFTDFVKSSAAHDGKGDVLYYFTRTKRPAPLEPMLDGMLTALRRVAPDLEEHHIQKTLFGHCPGYYPPGPFERWRLQPSAGDRVLLLGLAAQQYSGLTGCAFGALARNAERLLTGVDHALLADTLDFETLAKIDIDVRERYSQQIGETFAGTMAVLGDETALSPNQDWLTLCRAAVEAGLDPKLLGEALKDKMRPETLHRMLGMVVADPRVVEVVLVNNQREEGLLVWTILRCYFGLLAEEARLWFERRDDKYRRGLGASLWRLPSVLARSGRIYGRMRSARKRAAAGAPSA
jgi:hypothetical protein